MKKEKDRSLAGSSSDAGTAGDFVNHPPHYTRGPDGIECIQVTEHMGFCLGNAVKYIWRVAFGGKQSADPIEDLEKAIWYIRHEIKKRVDASQKADHRNGSNVSWHDLHGS